MVLKSAQHFAGAYGPLASLIVSADTGGCCPQDPAKHTYAKLKRPLWPLDPEGRGAAGGVGWAGSQDISKPDASRNPTSPEGGMGYAPKCRG